MLSSVANRSEANDVHLTLSSKFDVTVLGENPLAQKPDLGRTIRHS